MLVDPEFSAAIEAVSKAVSGLLPVASVLKREAQLARRCIVCPRRMALGRCPGRRTCKEVKSLGLDFDAEVESVTDSDEMNPVSDVVTIPPSMSTPLAAARGGSNGASQERSG